MSVTDNDILEEHVDLVRETDDDSDLVRTLRGQLRQTSKRAKDRDTLAEENTTLKTERLIDRASLTRNGEKVSLTERQRNSLLRELGPDATPDQVIEVAAEFGWADKPIDPAEREVDEHEQISNAARGGSSNNATDITPAMFAGWDMSKQRAFMKQHKTAFEALKKGETVKGITF